MSKLVNKHENKNYVLTKNTDIVGGELNGISRRVISKMVNINSLFRESESMGPCDEECHYEEYIETEWSSSNFIIRLPTSYDKVVSMNLLAIEMPHSFYTFDSKMKNNVFTIVDVEGITKEDNDEPVPYIFEIISGNYSNDELLNQINYSIANSPLNNKVFIKLNTITSKIFFISNNNFKFDLDFRLPNNESRDISMNFGWILGYRKSYYYYDMVIDNDNFCIYPSEYKTHHYKNSNTSINEFSTEGMNSFIQRNTIPSQEQRKHPEINANYENSIITFHPTSDPRVGHNDKRIDNLPPQVPVFPQGFVAEANINTKGPRYFFLLINDFNKSTNDSYQSLVNDNTQIPCSNILARLIIPTNRFSLGYYTSSDFIPKKRDYFGPVRIDKLHFRIVDEFGRTVNFNSSDISFLLEFEILYNL
tara:strand:+ start:3376 stop:4635 length:1260 start_codon:yes stop_codon:yes gene_type:complete